MSSDAPAQLPVLKVVEAIEDAVDMEIGTGGRRDLIVEVQMIEEEFDGVLDDCSRVRGSRAHDKASPPPRKEANKVSTPQNRSGVEIDAIS